MAVAGAGSGAATGGIFHDGMDVFILTIGVTFTYTIPSFSAIQVSLRQVTVQVELPDGSGKLYDGFIQAHPSLPITSSTDPFSIIIQRHCFVPVDEFCKVVYAWHLRAVEGRGLLVIMDWSTGSAEDEAESTNDDGDDEPDSSADDEEGRSSVDFKCIGVTKDPSYQTILSDVRDKLQLGENVDVRLSPEPDNPKDANAIAFQCMHQGHWKRIGYVVAEVCEEVLAAIVSGDILSVRFSWVKYKLWKTSPGFYASITVTRKGHWSKKIYESRNTFS